MSRKKNIHNWTPLEILRWTIVAFSYGKKLVHKNYYDLCHCWFGWPSGAIGYAFKRKVPYIVALRGSDVPGYNIRLHYLDFFFFRFLSRVVWKNAKNVIALSNQQKQRAFQTLSNIGIPIIPNGVNTAQFQPKKTRGSNILFVGRLIDRKGIIFLLEAFKEIHFVYSKPRLIIAGDGPEKKNLEEYCRNAGISKYVTFLGMISHNKIFKLYQQADIFVLPSLSEAAPNVTLEAMASGLPLITTNTGAAEMISGNGIVVEKENSEQIRDAILTYLQNRKLLEKHSKQSRKLAEKMTWEKSAKTYLEIYNQVKHAEIE